MPHFEICLNFGVAFFLFSIYLVSLISLARQESGQFTEEVIFIARSVF